MHFVPRGERWEKTRFWSCSGGSCCLSFLFSRVGDKLLLSPFASPPSQPAICKGGVSSWEKWEAENPQALRFAVPVLVCRTALPPLLLVPEGEAVEQRASSTACVGTLEMWGPDPADLLAAVAARRQDVWELCRGTGTSQASHGTARTPDLQHGGAEQPPQRCFGGAVQQRGLVTCPQPRSAGPAQCWKEEEEVCFT